MTDYNKSLQKLVDAVYIRRFGCLVEVLSDGFMMWGKRFGTLEEVDDYLKEVCERLGNALIQEKDGSHSSSDKEL